VVATVLQWLEIEAGFSIEGLKGQLLAQHPIIYKRTGLPIGNKKMGQIYFLFSHSK
jgi:hypothetical protein